MARFWIILILTVSLSLWSDRAQADSAPVLKAAVGLDTDLADKLVRVVPGNIVCRLPDAWVSAYFDSNHNIELDYTEIIMNEDGAGEWDGQYAYILNASLPIEAVAFQGGEEGWGSNSLTHQDLQVRMYLLENDLQTVKGVILEKFQPQAVKTLLHLKTLPKVEQTSFSSLPRFKIQFFKWVKDIALNANMDLVLKPVGKYTALFAFLYSGDTPKEVEITTFLSNVSVTQGFPR